MPYVFRAQGHDENDEDQRWTMMVFHEGLWHQIDIVANIYIYIYIASHKEASTVLLLIMKISDLTPRLVVCMYSANRD